MAVHGFSSDGAKRIVNVVRAVEADTLNRTTGREGNNYGDNRPGYWVRVASWSGTQYVVRKMRPTVTGTMEDDSGFTTEMAGVTLIAKPTLPIGARVWARLANRTAAGVTLLILDAPSYFQAFAVVATQVGGSAGDASTQCSFTYDIKDASGTVTLASAINPTSSPHLFNRPSYGACIAGDRGMAYYNSSDQLVVFLLNEVLDTESC